MALIEIDGLEKSFGSQVLFRSFSAPVHRGDRIALVGDNGVGKSTLLHILAGVEEQSAGRVHRGRGVRVGLLPQVARLRGSGTLYKAMEEAFADLLAAERELRGLEATMGKESDPEILARYDELLHRFEREDGYTIEARIRSVLSGVGFGEDRFDRPVELLSGGEEARAALARVLLVEPDLLLLDEPTNHLDFAALDWLEETLHEFAGGLVLVSHDRHLLDRVANRTWEIAFGEVTLYRGGYSQSRREREAERARRAEAHAAQEATIERHRDFIRRHHAGQKHGQAKDREKKIERIEKGLVEAPREAKRISLRVSLGSQSGKRVLVTEGLAVGFTSPLFTAPDLVLYRGERVALIGPNGCGKTTFLKGIAGSLPPCEGRIVLGHGVRVAVYSQTQEGLDGNGTVLDAILSRSSLSISQARGLLGRYLFSGNDVMKRMKALSGGERSRVALALLSLMEGNLLLLDEPTNHLDPASQEILEDALLAYEGTIVLVSHDRALLAAVSTQAWEVREGTLCVFPFGYREHKERTATAEAPVPAPKEAGRRERPREEHKRQKKPDRYEARRRLEEGKALEEEVERLEDALRGAEEGLLEASRAGDAGKVAHLGREYERLREALGEKVAAWERWASAGEGARREEGR